MSQLAERLRLPPGLDLPAELVLAWDWIDGQGWSGVDPSGAAVVAPHGGDAWRGPYFTDGATLDDWFDGPVPDEARARLVPLLELSPDGTVGALWRDDTGSPAWVVLAADGGYRIADSTIDLLRLLAIGYCEVTDLYLGDKPGDAECVSALAPFRAWVGETFAVTVPDEWPAPDEDDFTDWFRGVLGVEPQQPRPVPAGLPRTAVDGDLGELVDALGAADGVSRVAALVGAPDTRARTLRTKGLEVEVLRGRLETVWLTVGRYPRQLSPGVGTTRDEVLARWGRPERSGQGDEPWLRYVVAGRYVHLGFVGGRLSAVTLMVTAP